jgi:hypothetical protein
MSSSKKIDQKRDFALGVYLPETQNPIPSPFTHCIRVYLLREGWRGVELNQREGERVNSSQS